MICFARRHTTLPAKRRHGCQAPPRLPADSSSQTVATRCHTMSHDVTRCHTMPHGTERRVALIELRPKCTHTQYQHAPNMHSEYALMVPHDYTLRLGA